LRKLKKSSPVITDVLKSLMNLSSVNAVSGIEKLCPWLLQISYKKMSLLGLLICILDRVVELHRSGWGRIMRQWWSAVSASF
jgi:hypothetical protein